MDLELLNCRLSSIAVFRNVLNDDIISGLWQLLEDWSGISVDRFISAYGEFVSNLYKKNINLSEYILKNVLEDENFYIIGKAQGKVFDDYIVETVENELSVFQALSGVTPEDITENMDYNGFLPKWRTSEIDFHNEYSTRLKNISKYGYGKYSRYSMFIVRDGKTVPVKHPDPQCLNHLYGYERERKAVVDNTLALIEGKPAQNVLLYGDAGTGKSSTVKAIVNKYSSAGLRLIEITKDQLRDIPQIIEDISHNPLKFIIFIDDLTFTAGEDCFGALKAMLEGSVSTRADNIAIYATSNRRHLVKESFSDREGDDIHRNDTIQELISLSARFGLTVNFSKPDKKAYINIVKELAKEKGIDMDEDKLALKAESFAICGSGRSARTAKQFINSLLNVRD